MERDANPYASLETVTELLAVVFKDFGAAGLAQFLDEVPMTAQANASWLKTAGYFTAWGWAEAAAILKKRTKRKTVGETGRGAAFDRKRGIKRRPST